MVEDVFKERRGVSSENHFFQEIHVNSENLTHLFVRTSEQQDVVAVVVCRKSVKVGMLFAQVRRVSRSTPRERVRAPPGQGRGPHGRVSLTPYAVRPAASTAAAAAG